MNTPSRADRLRKLHTRRFGGQCSLDALAKAAIEEGIFPADISKEAALAACRRALSALDKDGLPFSMVMHIQKKELSEDHG